MTQKEKKQNNRELKFKFAESERKSIREEDDIKNVDLSVKEGYFKTEAYDVILLKFDKRLQEIDEQFKSNEELTERLLKEHQECESFVDEFLNEDD